MALGRAHSLDSGLVRTADVRISENADFRSLLLSEPVLQGLTQAGFVRPSPIQLKAIPVGRYGLDLIVQAKSGTGKTCVFAVIALENIILECQNVQVLILAPTREIAVQISQVILSIGVGMSKLKCYAFIGGTPFTKDKFKLRQCHIAVGTPGRVKQLIEEGFLHTDSIRLFVLDEADKLIAEGFQETINWIYSCLPQNKQMLALSATYPETLAKLLTRYMKSPTFVRLNANDPSLLGVKQYYCLTPVHSLPQKTFDAKVDILIQILNGLSFNQCLVFSNFQAKAQMLATLLTSHGWPTMFLAGSQAQNQRLMAMASLQQYHCRILVSTDLSARGIDAEYVNLVVNMDVPPEAETYLHRVGRAGRYGTVAIAVTIATEGKEAEMLVKMRTDLHLKMILLPDKINGSMWKTEELLTVPEDICENPIEPSNIEKVHNNDKETEKDGVEEEVKELCEDAAVADGQNSPEHDSGNSTDEEENVIEITSDKQENKIGDYLIVKDVHTDEVDDGTVKLHEEDISLVQTLDNDELKLPLNETCEMDPMAELKSDNGAKHADESIVTESIESPVEEIVCVKVQQTEATNEASTCTEALDAAVASIPVECQQLLGTCLIKTLEESKEKVGENVAVVETSSTNKEQDSKKDNEDFVKPEEKCNKLTLKLVEIQKPTKICKQNLVVNADSNLMLQKAKDFQVDITHLTESCEQDLPINAESELTSEKIDANDSIVGSKCLPESCDDILLIDAENEVTPEKVDAENEVTPEKVDAENEVAPEKIDAENEVTPEKVDAEDSSAEAEISMISYEKNPLTDADNEDIAELVSEESSLRSSVSFSPVLVEGESEDEICLSDHAKDQNTKPVHDTALESMKNILPQLFLCSESSDLPQTSYADLLQDLAQFMKDPDPKDTKESADESATSAKTDNINNSTDAPTTAEVEKIPIPCCIHSYMEWVIANKDKYLLPDDVVKSLNDLLYKRELVTSPTACTLECSVNEPTVEDTNNTLTRGEIVIDNTNVDANSSDIRTKDILETDSAMACASEETTKALSQAIPVQLNVNVPAAECVSPCPESVGDSTAGKDSFHDAAFRLPNLAELDEQLIHQESISLVERFLAGMKDPVDNDDELTHSLHQEHENAMSNVEDSLTSETLGNKSSQETVVHVDVTCKLPDKIFAGTKPKTKLQNPSKDKSVSECSDSETTSTTTEESFTSGASTVDSPAGGSAAFAENPLKNYFNWLNLGQKANTKFETESTSRSKNKDKSNTCHHQQQHHHHGMGDGWWQTTVPPPQSPMPPVPPNCACLMNQYYFWNMYFSHCMKPCNVCPCCMYWNYHSYKQQTKKTPGVRHQSHK